MDAAKQPMNSKPARAGPCGDQRVTPDGKVLDLADTWSNGLSPYNCNAKNESELERGEQLERRRIVAGGKANDIMAKTTPIDLHPAYFEVRFRTDVPVAHWPDRFAIITAYATTGETWSDQRNIEADARLYASLLERQCKPIRIVGFDPETGHSEPGWAVDLAPEEAQAIGLQFLQGAIFLVEGDVLRMARSVVGSPWLTAGAFRERLSVSRTPHGIPAKPKNG